MLVRALYLSALWFAISLFATLIMGSRLRRSDSTLSLLWLAGVILAGNLLAILTFGRILEIFGLSLLAFLFGLYWINAKTKDRGFRGENAVSRNV